MYSLSPLQQGMLFHALAAPSSGVDIEQIVMRLNEPLDIERFADAWRTVIGRHPILRTQFQWEDVNEPQQLVVDDVDLPIDFIEISHLSDKKKQAFIDKTRAEDRQKDFDFASAPLMRLTIFELDSAEYVVLWSFHHILLDGRSFPLVLQEVFSVYAVDGEAPTLMLPRPYEKYIEWRSKQDFDAAKPFWQQQLAGFAAKTPIDFGDVPAKSHKKKSSDTNPVAWGETETRLNKNLTAQLSKFAEEQNVTLHTLIQSAWALLLHHYSNEKDVVFASTRACRYWAEDAKQMVGLFINTVPLRVQIEANQTLANYLTQIREQQVAVRDYEHTPLPTILRCGETKGDEALFDSLVVYDDATLDERMSALGKSYENRSFSYHGQTNFPLTVLAYGGERLLVRLEYDPNRFSAENAKIILNHLRTLLKNMPTADEEVALKIPYLSEVEAQQFFHDWNLPLGSVPAWSVQDQIAMQATRTPDKLAVRYERITLTYTELEARANQVARYLQKFGVGPNVLVGLCLPRSAEMVIGMLAILKAGGAYVPLDPEYPTERLEHMLTDSAASVLVTQEDLLANLPTTTQEIVCLDRDWTAIEHESAKPLKKAKRNSADTAYVIYTSGSTGKPKGVMVQHSALANFLSSMQAEPGIVPSDRVLNVTTISFDIAALEIFLPLIRGAELVMVSAETAANGTQLAETIYEADITVMQATPSRWRLLVESEWAGKPGLKMLCGGEPLPQQLASELLELGGELWNMYGPTETTIWSTVQKIEKDEAINIGRPIANTDVYVLDEFNQQKPVGIVGQLAIGGHGVTLGYKERPELTQEKFIPNPYLSSSLIKPPSSLLYLTGDLARFNADGTIEVLGRSDHQVKIRGFRIELGEIETVLESHPAVQATTVIARDLGMGSKQLVAYFVAEDAADVDVNTLRTHSASKLPDYMVPAVFVKLDEFPLTDNGKINRLALPAPEGARPELENAYTPPRTPTEKKVAAIWRELLLVDKVGAHDSFFDLGGDSILVVRAVSAVRQRFNTKLSVDKLYEHRSVHALAEHLDSLKVEEPKATEVKPSATQKKAASKQSPERNKQRSASGDIAIIGMAGRFPGAENLDTFWENLVAGKEGIKRFSDEELRDLEPDFDKIKDDPDYIPAAGYLEGVELFDAEFFGIKPRQAKALDPQHRLWLETAWEAVERAGYAPSKYDGAIGVFTGSYINSYLFYNLSPDREAIEGFVRLQSLDSFLNMISNEKDYLPTRTSYHLNLRGPAINVQTACSTSLVAVSQAVQSLRSGESDMALAGGVAIFLPQERGYFYQEGGMLSSDGHCRPFSKGGSGTVFGSGVGAVLLKRLEDAEADNDNILAVVRGTGLNNDGAFKASYTAPSIEGQSAVIAMAQANAGVSPDEISYVEAHGTATPLGDPIEIAGLTKAFRTGTDETQFCGVGAVKSGIGHLDAAAGVAGLIKTVLALHNEQIPPTLHFEEPNSEIDFEETPFYVVNKLTPWPRSEKPRVAGISSFGVGGTNAHVVVGEAPVAEAGSDSRSQQLFALSAKTDTALTTMQQNLAAHLQNNKVDFADAAFTLRQGRTDHAYRSVFVADSAESLITQLRAENSAEKLSQNNPPITFLFPGQGSQYLNMGRELYDSEPVFKETVDACAKILKPLLKKDIRTLIYPKRITKNSAAKLQDTIYAQPAIFVIEYALAQLWASWGIKPSAMIGHSVGEFAAATLAGVFSLKDALKVLANRAKLMQDLPGGSMRAVLLSAEKLKPFLGKGVTLAAHNAPTVCVVSGDDAAIEKFDARVAKAGHETIKLHTSHAFHSAMMEPILKPFAKIVASVERNAPTLPIISTVTGKPLTAKQAQDPQYWAEQLRNAVLFSDALTFALQEDGQLFLECGPSTNLSGAVKRHGIKKGGHAIIDSLGHVKEEKNALAAVLEGMGKLWMAGVSADWDAFYANETRRRIPLPTYPFERKRYWVEPPALAAAGQPASAPAGQPVVQAQPAPAAIAPPAQQAYQVQPNVYQQQNYQSNFQTNQPAFQPQVAIPQNQAVVAPSAPAAEVNSMNRRDQILARVNTLLADLSGIEMNSADYDTSFIELGYDSLTLTQVSSVLKGEFGVVVRFRKLLEDISTPNLLAAHLDAEIAPEMFAETAAPQVSQPAGQPAQQMPQQQMMPQQGQMQPQNMGVPNMGAQNMGMQMPQMPMQPMMPQMGMNPMMQQAMMQQQMMMQMWQQQQMAMMGMGQQMPPQMMGMNPMMQPQAMGGQMPPQQQMPQSAPAAAPQAPAAPSAKNAGANTPPDAPNYNKVQSVSKVAFGPYVTVPKGEKGQLTESQAAHLKDLTARMLAKTGKSRDYAQEYRDVLACPRTITAFRQVWKDLVYQIVTTRSKGSKVWDIDDNEYVDLTTGFGINFLGHSPDFVTDALHEQLDKGVEIGPQSPLLGDVSRLACEVTGHDRVSFCNTGSEAVMATIRVARTVTGRDKIVWFSGDYHGVFDEVLARPQISKGKLKTSPAAPGITADSVKNSYILEYGDPASLDFIREHAHELAAVLIEPVQSRHPDVRPKEFIQAIREITAESGTAMVFDEVITGFRVHARGMQHVYDVQPDMCAYGKIIGGGMPIGAVAGKRKWMDSIDGGFWQYGDDSLPEADLTFFAGTFVRHPLAMAAAKATLEHIRDEGPELQQNVTNKMTKFANEMNAWFNERQVPIRINNYASWFRFEVPKDIQFMDLLFYHLLEKGVYVFTFFQNCFFSTVHTDEDIAKIQRAIMEGVVELQNAGFLPEAPAGATDPFALTEAQKEIWVASQLDEKAALPYNESFSLRLRGELRPAFMQAAVQATIQRHAALHMRFSPEGDWQKRAEQVEIELPYVDLSAETNPAESLKTQMDATLAAPFDLENGPLVRVTLYKVSKTEHLFHWTANHIVYDGWSAVVVIDEMRTLYNAMVSADSAVVDQTSLLPRADSYREYVKWEQAFENSAEGQAALAYWIEQFKTLPAPLDLPSDRPRPAVKSYNGTSQHFEFDADVVAAARKTAAKQKSSLFMLLLSAYNVLLYRLTDQSDLVVGIPMAGQALAEKDNLVGHCVNILPIRTAFEGNTPFSEVMATVRGSFLDGQENQPCSFGRMLPHLNVPRDASRSPLVETVFNLDRVVPPEPFTGCDTEIREVPKQAINWEMFLNLYEEEGTLKADFDYNSDLYDGATIERWLEHFQEILRAAATNPAAAVNELNMLSAEQRNQLLVGWNDTYQPHPRNVLIHEMVEAQAKKTPSAVAWVYEGKKLTYRQLDSRSNKLGHYLQGLGVSAETRVGILLDRNLEMGVAVLGVVKAGGTYVPLAPDYPAERVQYILEDSGATLLIAEEKQRHLLKSVDKPIIFIDSDWKKITRKSAKKVSCDVTPESTAYIIYTSGSTGRPKGAMLPHRAITNFSHWYNRHYNLDASDAVMLKAPFGFDASVWEIFTSLTNGGRVVVCKQDGTTDSDYLIDLIVEQNVTSAFFVPTHLRILLDNPRMKEATNLKLICCGGEAFAEDLRQKFNETLPTVRLDNFYGPTETCIGMLTWNSADNSADTVVTPIGYPTDNMQAYVLSKTNLPQPVGVAGELCIGGVQVAHGYNNRAELTASQFVKNPFKDEMADAKSDVDSAELATLYRTGDYVRWTAEGAIEYVGRIDHQVKIRGLRIELGEIEAGLVAHHDIGQAVVIARTDAANEQQIVAYTVRTNGHSAEPSELRKHLRGFVPNYMVPNAFVELPELPTTPNGKLDRAALPEPIIEAVSTSDQDQAPRDAVEQKLVEFWEDALNVKPIGIHDDFFELGGHSLMALRLFAAVEAEYEQKLPLSLLISAPTVAELADVLREKMPVVAPVKDKPLPVADTAANAKTDAEVAADPKPVVKKAAPAKEHKDWTSLFAIRPKGNKRPFFYVTAYMESVLEYNYLSQKLDQTRPFYLFQAQGLDGFSPIHQSIPAMAQHYISELKQVQGSGPYLLGGHCAGAWIAFEMANQLRKEGAEIDVLAIVDSMPPHVPEPEVGKLTHMSRRLGYYLKDRRLMYALKWQYDVRMQGKLVEQFGSDQERVIQAVRNVHHKAYEQYEVPRDYTGPMLHVRSSEFANIPEMSFHEAWRDLTTQQVPIEVIDSTHASILHAKNAPNLARILTPWLDAADKK